MDDVISVDVVLVMLVYSVLFMIQLFIKHQLLLIIFNTSGASLSQQQSIFFLAVFLEAV